ncbi:MULTISPECIES: hypothetical protein [unclassified Mucilaginibacter]|uniref:hypothetical protein n=1 Tax=unclassified Mucilaginibacter TaxID=2617802 RepID=UPI002AC96B4B|nr:MULTISPECIES: hypothetical protein [unclassified Mucilaginibacter]MEB0262534.1 hypothetical protein [Mucilaginibacter sp. 10I4]MEB0277977.1 hypothetical protein [Mucilaginibacter sp. 10B2]MEB0299670.1 hypothetical protein [Mucilaginibacter sp. 5C4]WPX22866.1 hypothetical protein RHM67_16425 [Mucilaginibacter sp. 5C4]
MSVEESLKKVCKALKIEFDPGDMQDWGIVNSDPTRVAEFIKYYKSVDLDEETKFHVFELVVASYNDAILGRLAKGQAKADFLEIIKESHSVPRLKIVRDYWKEIYNKENFPVGKLL